MKIWFNYNHIRKNKFCSEQLILTPFLETSYIKTNPSFEDIDDYKEKIQENIKLSSIEECDYIVYPNKFEASEEMKEYIGLATQYNKKLISFYVDDSSIPTASIPNLNVFRTSILKSKKKNHEYAMPAWSKDFKKYKDIPLRKKQLKPTIGFCGYIDHPETTIRKKCVTILNTHNKINTNFIIRKAFWGGKIDDINLRNEYVDNMINSDFILCTRGSGNFSYRLYETLSAGRIPIFIDTDCCIPFDNTMRYNDYFPIIKESEISNTESIILDFWNNINDYELLQNKLYQLYVEYFSPYGFIHQLSRMSL